MALRHLDFDVEALGTIAAKAYGASECNEIEVIGEGHWNILLETNMLNPFQGHSTAYIALVSTLAVMLLLVSRFVMLDRGASLHVARWQRWTLYGLALVPQFRKCSPGTRPQIIM
jgi:hypothetical protein